jgi:hypothetical protein
VVLVIFTFIDDHSRLTWVYVFKDISQLFSAFQSFCVEISNQFNVKLLTFRIDNACKYLDNLFKQFLESRGIIRGVAKASLGWAIAQSRFVFFFFFLLIFFL